MLYHSPWGLRSAPRLLLQLHSSRSQLPGCLGSSHCDLLATPYLLPSSFGFCGRESSCFWLCPLATVPKSVFGQNGKDEVVAALCSDVFRLASFLPLGLCSNITQQRPCHVPPYLTSHLCLYPFGLLHFLHNIMFSISFVSFLIIVCLLLESRAFNLLTYSQNLVLGTE